MSLVCTEKKINQRSDRKITKENSVGVNTARAGFAYETRDILKTLFHLFFYVWSKRQC